MDEIINDISDKIFLKELRNEFKTSVEENLVKLNEFYMSSNFSGMRKIAHDIKGVAGIFGFDKGTELAAELLKYIDSEDRDKILGPYTKLIEYMKKNVLNVNLEE